MSFEKSEQYEKAKMQAKATGQTWYLIKFPNVNKYRAVSDAFFASQPQLKQNIVDTIHPW